MPNRYVCRNEGLGRIAGQHEEYLVNTLHGFISGVRSGGSILRNLGPQFVPTANWISENISKSAWEDRPGRNPGASFPAQAEDAVSAAVSFFESRQDEVANAIVTATSTGIKYFSRRV
jgi:hypothetical protein